MSSPFCSNGSGRDVQMSFNYEDQEMLSQPPIAFTEDFVNCEIRDRRVLTDEEKERLDAFKQFMYTIPRTVSPTICGTIGFKTGSSSVREGSSSDLDYQFEWSIDHAARLDPCNFSASDNPSFFEDDASLNEHLRRECEQFFENAARQLSSPETVGDNKGRHRQNSLKDCLPNLSTPMTFPCSSSRRVTPRLTPYKNVDMNVSEVKLPTPTNSSKTKQKKKKLFVEETEDLGIRELQTLIEDENSNSNSCDCHDQNDIEMSSIDHRRTLCSMTASTFSHFDAATLSPIAGDGLGMADFSSDSDVVFNPPQALCSSAVNGRNFKANVVNSPNGQFTFSSRLDSGCVSNTVNPDQTSSSFFAKTSTPSLFQFRRDAQIQP